MKTLFKISIIGIVLSLLFAACSDFLEEQPRSNLTPDFFQTSQGAQAGIISAYSGLRWLFGPDGAIHNSVTGTDEFTTTDQNNGGQEAFNTYDPNLSPTNGNLGNWNNGLQFINTLNGVIQYGEDLPGLSDADRNTMLAEARFLRGFYYYQLASYYGGVPLDLGQGKLKFNNTISTTSIRDSREDVLNAIIEDLQFAKLNLPDKPSAPGRAAKPAAMHFLAKAYLSKASYFGNQSDYQSAYNEAKGLIDNAASYGVSLAQDYANVNLEGHENDPEVLFNVQRTWTSAGPNMTFEESNDGSFAVANKGNRTNFFFTAGYENVRISNGNAQIVPRSIYYQRPWRMIMPTQWLIFNAFNDKVNDSRFDNSFRMEWNAGIQFNVGNRTVNVGDLAIKITLNQTETAEANDSVAPNGVIYKPYALYYWGMLYNANGTYRLGDVQYMYPNLKKFDDTKRPNMNYDSNRPFIVARFAETYLVAAEAALNIGNLTAAKDNINVIRERAAYRPDLDAAELAARKAAMDINENQINIDFILDERAREMCGEGWRWLDLQRTNKLIERAKLYNYKAAPNIQEKHLLRPIPQTQIDLMSDPAQKAAYQNPGY